MWHLVLKIQSHLSYTTRLKVMFLRTIGLKGGRYHYREVLESYRRADRTPVHRCLARWNAALTLSEAIQQAEERADVRCLEKLLNARLFLASRGIPEPAALVVGQPAERSAASPDPDRPPVANATLPVEPQPAPVQLPSVRRFEPLLPPPRTKQQPAPANDLHGQMLHLPPDEPDADLAPPTGDFNQQLQQLNPRLVTSVLTHALAKRSLYDICAVTSTSLAKVRQVLTWLEQLGLLTFDPDTGRIRVSPTARLELGHRTYSNGKPSSLFTPIGKPSRVT